MKTRKKNRSGAKSDAYWAAYRASAAVGRRRGYDGRYAYMAAGASRRRVV